jgi:hypothetical protein
MPFKPLPCKRVKCALGILGFKEQPNTSGTSHEKWVAIRDGHKYVATLDCHHGEVRALDIKSIIDQTGVGKKRFWRAIEQC